MCPPRARRFWRGRLSVFRGGGRAPEKSPRSFSRLRGGLAKTAAALRSDGALALINKSEPTGLRRRADAVLWLEKKKKDGEGWHERGERTK
ncbi:MAG: hypothetical protein MPK62_07130 [Alphaproteobacteria bacterium]|nr:hypothetical protein [Alphaproteobacteria bacterium]